MSPATLAIDSRGEAVRRLQSELQSRGFDPGPVDGAFGPQTEAAVRQFQQAMRLDVDGIVGPATWSALGKADEEIPPVSSSLVDIGLAAEREFGLVVGECSAPGAPARWGPVHSGHSAKSLHFHGRAFDAGGSAEDMRRFAAWVDQHFAGALAELIHNPNGSIKDGGRVDPSFWGDDTWAGHADHVHLAI